MDDNETNDTDRFRQRTLAVLPLDNPEIREIEVHVLKGVTEDVYEQVFLVRNVSRSSAAEIVEGSLYIDFAMTPGIKIISHQGKLKIKHHSMCLLATFSFKKDTPIHCLAEQLANFSTCLKKKGII